MEFNFWYQWYRYCILFIIIIKGQKNRLLKLFSEIKVKLNISVKNTKMVPSKEITIANFIRKVQYTYKLYIIYF